MLLLKIQSSYMHVLPSLIQHMTINKSFCKFIYWRMGWREEETKGKEESEETFEGLEDRILLHECWIEMKWKRKKKERKGKEKKEIWRIWGPKIWLSKCVLSVNADSHNIYQHKTQWSFKKKNFISFQQFPIILSCFLVLTFKLLL